MRIVFTVVAILLLQFLVAQKKQPLKIIDAFSQHWVSGAPGGRTGKNYQIKILVNTDMKIEFKNLWLGKESVPFNLEFFWLDVSRKIVKGDSVLLTYNEVYPAERKSENTRRLPIHYKGDALIESLIDGKAHYLIVPKIYTSKVLLTQ
jgi:hypothetical protein